MKNFQTACSLLGWGDPQNGIWFIGVEEATAWTKELLESHVKNGSPQYAPESKRNWKELGYAGKSIRDYTSKVVQPLSRQYFKKSWQEYRDGILWAEGSQIFQANYFPLGKPSLKDWPSQYAELFELKSSDLKKYKELVRECRAPLLQKLWKDSKPQATVCFGIYAWREFESLFQLNPDSAKWLDEDIAVYEEQKIILSPFLGQGMSDMKAKFITEQLEKWKCSVS